MEHPRIVSRKETVLSPWVTLVEKEVCFREGTTTERYHSLAQAPYVAVLAVTRDGRIPLVRQYRPAVEGFTWEFPAGTVDEGETAAAAISRELQEETGLQVSDLHEIGSYYPDTGRLSVGSTGFFASCDNDLPDRSPETDLELRAVSADELLAMVRSGAFRHQLHIALIGSAVIKGHLALPRYDRHVHSGPSQTTAFVSGPELPRS